MTALASHADRAGGLARLAVWICAAAFVTTAYGFGIGWLMQRPVETEGADETLPAIMIELAEEPAAVNTDDNVASVDQTDSQEIKSDETQPLPDPVVEEKVKPEPVEDEPEPEPVVEDAPDVEPLVDEVKPEVLPEPIPPVEEEDPIVEEVTKVMDNVAVPLPMTRPRVQEINEKQPEKKVETKKARKKREVAAQKSVAAVKAGAKVQQSKTNAAKTTSEGASKATIERWKSRVAAHILRRKRRLAHGGETAVRDVQIRFRIDDGGNVLSVSVSRSSGSDELDRAAVALVRNSSPVPTPPEGASGASKNITMPVGFDRR